MYKKGNGPRVTYFVVRSPLGRCDRHRFQGCCRVGLKASSHYVHEFRIPKEPMFERRSTEYFVQYRTLVLMALSGGTEAATLNTDGTEPGGP